METKENVVLCKICYKRKAINLGMCGTCQTMDQAIRKLIEEKPKQADNYLKKISKLASRKLRNRFMSKKVGE